MSSLMEQIKHKIAQKNKNKMTPDQIEKVTNLVKEKKQALQVYYDQITEIRKQCERLETFYNQQIQNICTHEDEAISHSDNWDGYSWVTVTYTTVYKCKHCERKRTEQRQGSSF